MDPVEAGEWLGGRPLQLIFLTGLDTSNKPVHKAILNAFSTRSPERPPLRIRLFSGDHEVAVKTEKKGKGILKREWPRKYLEKVPALIVLFMDLDWDHPSWAEKKLEAESKVESIRGSMKNGTKIAMVLLQERSLLAVGDDALTAERATELSQHCQLSSKQLFVLPVNGDLHGYVVKLEAAFHELAQGFYQFKLKSIRARAIPNNSDELFVRQMFKLAFLSELRQDTHNALRHYKSAYERCRDVQDKWNSIDVFEWRSVVGLLNYKICDIGFLHNIALETIAQMRRHQNTFFNSQPGTYPTPQLAAIEFSLWKSKQCWQFAQLFEKAVLNGLTAVATINPGTHLDGAASHFAQANILITQLKATLQLNVSYPQPDPLASTTEFFGQRSWRYGLDGIAHAQIEENAVLALQQRLLVNHEGVLSLLKAAKTQYSKYGCTRMQMKIMNEMAEEYSFAGDVPRALQLWSNVMKEGNLPESVRGRILNRSLWTAFSQACLRECAWSLIQLLKTPANADPTVSSEFAQCLHSILQGKVPQHPYSSQITEQQKQHFAGTWQSRLSEPQFFSVNCSKVDTFVQVSTCFLYHEPCSTDSKVPIRVSLLLQSHHPIAFSGIRVACDVFGRTKNTDEPAPFNLFRSNIALEPYKRRDFFFVLDLSEYQLKEGQVVLFSRVSLELGERSGRVFGSLDWEGNTLTKQCMNLLDPWSIGHANVRISGLLGQVVNVNDKHVECLLAEVATVKIKMKNETSKDIEQLRLEFKRNEQSPDASCSVLFVDDENELRSEMSILVAEKLAKGEEIEQEIRFSAQLLGDIELILESSFRVLGQDTIRSGRVPLAVTSREPFTVRSQVLTTNGIPVTTVLNHSTHLLKVDLKSNADIEISQIEWLLGDVVSNASTLAHSEPLAESDILTIDDVISYCTPIDISSLHEGSEKPLGRMAVQWRRSGSDIPVRSLVPLCRTTISPCPVSVCVEVTEKRAEMRRPIHLTYLVKSNHKEAVDICASFDLTDTFMFSGDKRQTFKLLPGAIAQINVVVMALSAGRLSFPRVALSSEQIEDSVLMDTLRTLPATLFVLPLSKDSTASSAA